MVKYFVSFEEDDVKKEVEVLIPADKTDNKDLCEELKNGKSEKCEKKDYLLSTTTIAKIKEKEK